MLVCVLVISTCFTSAFALTAGPKGSNKTYNTTTYFMIDGTLYEAPQSKYSYRADYDSANSKYYFLDGCGITSKNSTGTARQFYVRATTTKRASKTSVYSSNPFNSAGANILYSGSGKITCKVEANAGFPLGSKTSSVTGTNSYCEAIVSYKYDGKTKLAGTITCSKPYASGTVNVNVEAY